MYTSATSATRTARTRGRSRFRFSMNRQEPRTPGGHRVWIIGHRLTAAARRRPSTLPRSQHSAPVAPPAVVTRCRNPAIRCPRLYGRPRLAIAASQSVRRHDQEGNQMKKRLCSALTAVAVLVSLAALDPDGISAAAALAVRGSPCRPPPRSRTPTRCPTPIRQDTFRLVWETVRDKSLDATLGGVDWNAVRTRYQPEVRKAATIKDLHDVLNRMVHELPRQPPERPRMRFTQTVEPDVMVPDYVQLRVGAEGILGFSVPEDSPVWRAGIRPGYRVIGIGDVTFPDAAAIRAARARPLSQARRLLSGPQGSEVQVRVLDADNRERAVALTRTVIKKRNIARAEAPLLPHPAQNRVPLVRQLGVSILSTKLEPLLGGTPRHRRARSRPSGRTEAEKPTPGRWNRLAKFLMAEAGLVAVITPPAGRTPGVALPGQWQRCLPRQAGHHRRRSLRQRQRGIHRSHAGVGPSGLLSGVASYWRRVEQHHQQPLPTGGVLQYPHFRHDDAERQPRSRGAALLGHPGGAAARQSSRRPGYRPRAGRRARSG